jgi:hypothetical protein
VFCVEREIRPISSGAGEVGAITGGLRKWCMRVFDFVLVCVRFEVGVRVGCGFT